MTEAKWRIEELSQLAAGALELAPVRNQVSGRVRDVPDVRMIRYYTTIGLVDRASEIRGRTAFYGPKHLRQLVAIKRLQAQGRSLVEVQQCLAGASTKRLDQLAELPPGFVEAALAGDSTIAVPPTRDSPTRDSATEDAETKRESRQESTSQGAASIPEDDRLRFWSAAPIAAGHFPEETGAALKRESQLPQQVAVIVPLNPGVSLLIDGIRPEQLSEEIVAFLQPAVTVLRDALVRAGLRRPGPQTGAISTDPHPTHEESQDEPQH